MTIALKTLCAFLAVINNAGYYKEKNRISHCNENTILTDSFVPLHILLY